MNASSASLALNMANFRTQVLGSLMDLGSDSASSFGDIMSLLQGKGDNSLTAPDSNALLGGSSSSAELLTNLGAPGSAYAMMTRINGLEVGYKAQFSELSQMDAYLPRMAEAAQQLGKTAVTGSGDSIAARLQDFAAQYNAWIQRFSPDVQRGGVLANTQAAELPLYELDQVIESSFIGAKDGFRGLADFGINIDSTTGLMSLDSVRLDAVLASNKQAVVDAVGEFSAKFAASANLLASDDNVIQHWLNNLHGAISYIDGNVGSWQQEFGSGDAASPRGKIAEALAAYNQAYSV